MIVAGQGLDAPLELLASLVKQSMVARSGHDRYRLLDTLRAYALEHLAELDADDTRDRHADVYVRLAEQGEVQIRGADQLAWLEQLRSDVNNLRAALEWCLLTGDTTRTARLAGALAWFWTLNGMLTEAIQHLERLVDVADVPPPIRARCLWGYALLAASLGRLETARDAGYRAAEVARGCDDTGVAYGLNAAAVAEWALGNHERSLDAHREAIALLDKLDDRWGLAVCNVLLARTLFDVGDPAADAVAATGVDHARRAGDRHVLGIALTQVAQIAIAGGDAHAAVSAASEALELQELIGYTEGIVSALHVLGHATDCAATSMRPGTTIGVHSCLPRGSGMPPRCARRSRTWPATRLSTGRIWPPCCCTRREPSAPVGASRCASGTLNSLPTSNGRCTPRAAPHPWTAASTISWWR